MRRYIAYLTLSAAMLIASGAALAPTVMNMDADLAYAEGQTFYFKASEYLDESQNGNYGVADQYGALEFLTEDDIDKNGEYIVEVDTDSSMFHVNETWKGKGILTVKDGEMMIHIVMPSKNVLNLYIYHLYEK